MKTITIDGKPIQFDETTECLVEVGRHKGSFKPRYSLPGDPNQAVFYYRCINIGNGYKKRLRVGGKVIARSYSQ